MLRRSVKKSSNGFGIVPVLLGVLVIGVIGIGSWYVIQSNRTRAGNAETNSTPQTAQNDQTEQEVPQENTNLIKIPELGIEMTVPDSLKDLIYETQSGELTDGRSGIAALFSTKAIIAADPNCGPSNSPVGALIRVEGKYPETNSGTSRLVKQFTTFYISVDYPNGGCESSDTELQAPPDGWKAQLSESLPTIREIE